MATSYTSPLATVKGITYKTEVTSTPDGGLKTVTLKSSTPNGTFAPVTSTITDKSGKTNKPSSDGFPSATASDKAAFANPTSPESISRNTQVESASTKIFGSTPNAQQQKLVNSSAGKPNAATNSPASDAQGGTPPTSEQSAAAAADVSSFKDGTRKSYTDDMKYPINLKSEVQDVIKFSILEYSPSLAKGNRSESEFGSGKSRVVTLEKNNPIVKGSKRIGTIILPIPAGISDSNTAGWQSGDLNMLQSAAAKAADTLLSGGTIGEAVTSGGGGVKPALDTGDASDAIRGIFVGMAAQGSGIMQRTQGAVLNNNTELLFSGPGLRSFSFAFLFYPRSEPEARRVRQIIRAFKQAMSVKRSATSLLLKSPHTFAIQYMTSIGGKTVAHPYLNRFKECALTSCSVDYTPDGTYMTYDGNEKSMTAYRLGLSFQELEPLFDDEYNEIDGNKDLEIGF